MTDLLQLCSWSTRARPHDRAFVAGLLYATSATHYERGVAMSIALGRDYPSPLHALWISAPTRTETPS